MAKTVIHIPQTLIWDPQPDITTYELALCIPILMAIGKQHQFYDQLPEEARRHWKAEDG
jgi:hypothetical protein